MSKVKVLMLRNQTIGDVVYKRNREYLLAADMIDGLADKKILIVKGKPALDSKPKKD